MVEIKGQLDKIKYYLKNEFYDVVVKETSAIFEVILKKIYARALAEFSFDQRNELIEAEKLIGQNKSYTQFGFGQLVGLFNRSKLLDKWSKMRGESLGILRSISLDSIVDLRNELTHNAVCPNVAGHTARLVYECLMNWLAFIGYAELPMVADNVFKPITDAVVKEEEHNYKDHLNEKINSSYTPDTAVERKRLVVQAQLSEEIDRQSFELALKKIGRTCDLIGLDIGVANGYVTETRFKKEYGFTKVLGLDKEATVLQGDHDYFVYRHLDVERDDFEDEIDEIMEKLSITSFDVVYMSFSLHHLTNPVKFLRRVRKIMSTGGVIILKGVDDEAQLAFGDNGLVKEIIDEFLQLDGISDRLHARKFYSQLKGAGFDDVMMKYQVTNTVGLNADEKEAIYNYYFGFRKYYSKRLIDKNPNNQEYRNKHLALVEKLEKLEEIFLKPDLYYHVLLINAIGVKN